MSATTPSDMKSEDNNSSRLEELKRLLPDIFTNEGMLNVDELKKLIDPQLVSETERYDFRWYGKTESKREAFTPSSAGLRLDLGRSVNPDKAGGNAILEGENLEVLKLLSKAYRGRVKLIYIDPPYNSGKDFIYVDDFRRSRGRYWEDTGAVQDGIRIDSNPETSGRFHSDWLSMMHSRLLSARYLMHQEGFIIVSIDDNEFFNLSRLMDEVFGEENFIATLVWDKNRKNDAKFFSVGHEYMLVYAKDKLHLQELGTILRVDKSGVDEVKKLFDDLRAEHNDDWEKVREGLKEVYATWEADDPRKPLARFNKVDEQGPYRDDGNINWPYGDGPTYEILHPVTGKPVGVPTSGWRYSTPERFWELHREGKIVFGPDESTVPGVRMNLFDAKSIALKSVQFSYAQTATQQFDKIFGGKKIFQNPKSFDDLRLLIDYLTEEGDTILDFFAGSGSTAHATLLANADRHFILVQLPEAISDSNKTGQRAREMGFRKISDITIERVKRVINGYADVPPMPDKGFKVYTLAKSLFPRTEFLPDPDRTAEENAVAFRAYIAEKESVLDLQLNIEEAIAEVLLKNGFMLDYSMTKSPLFSANHVYLAKDAHKEALICLDPSIQPETVELFKTHQETIFICLEQALDTTKKWNLKHWLGDKLRAL